MGPLVQFIFAIVIGVVTLAGTSLLWPKMTSLPRPKFFSDVRSVVVETPAGKGAASVLGVTDESTVKPISLGEAVAGAATGVKTAVQNRVQTIVVTNAVRELTKQFDSLPPDQQKQVQEAVCKPQE